MAAEEQKQLAVSPAVAVQKPQSFDDKVVKVEERIPQPREELVWGARPIKAVTFAVETILRCTFSTRPGLVGSPLSEAFFFEKLFLISKCRP